MIMDVHNILHDNAPRREKLTRPLVRPNNDITVNDFYNCADGSRLPGGERMIRRPARPGFRDHNHHRIIFPLQIYFPRKTRLLQ